jgi:hypothetical protein
MINVHCFILAEPCAGPYPVSRHRPTGSSLSKVAHHHRIERRLPYRGAQRCTTLASHTCDASGGPMVTSTTQAWEMSRDAFHAAMLMDPNNSNAASSLMYLKRRCAEWDGLDELLTLVMGSVHTSVDAFARGEQGTSTSQRKGHWGVQTTVIKKKANVGQCALAASRALRCGCMC